MRKFKKGDKVKVRLDNPSPYRGRIGVVQQELPQDSQGYWYMVEFQSAWSRAVNRFAEKDLEPAT